ncbi:MAG: hypothetical protein HY907_17530 [Deltaproteobacteria bacterium]|nr:hypothetical protein [Deltaproteobacteria bacterium]
MGFRETLDDLFPGALPAQDYLAKTTAALRRLGFDREHAIACVGVCRDELTRPFVDQIQRIWGEAFNFSSLAGMLLLGRTGFSAALHHAPTGSEIRRYIFFAMPHIGIGQGGEPGLCRRAGQDQPSGACGALIAFRKELEGGNVRLELDPDDVEQSLLKQRLFPLLRHGDVPDLPHLTRIMHSVIVEDLERGISLAVDPLRAAWAELTGIQIHGPDRQEWIWPAESQAWVQGVREPLTIG